MPRKADEHGGFYLARVRPWVGEQLHDIWALETVVCRPHSDSESLREGPWGGAAFVSVSRSLSVCGGADFVLLVSLSQKECVAFPLKMKEMVGFLRVAPTHLGLMLLFCVSQLTSLGLGLGTGSHATGGCHPRTCFLSRCSHYWGFPFEFMSM